MARTERQFRSCDEMRNIADKLLDRIQQWTGPIDSTMIRFDLIVSDKAKNSSPVVVDQLKQDWVKQETPHRGLVAIYKEVWDEWDPTRKQWEMLEALLKVCNVKPDLVGYRFVYDWLRTVMKDEMPEVDFRHANEAYNVNLPNLLSETVLDSLPSPDEYEIPEDSSVNDDAADEPPIVIQIGG